MQRFDDPVQFYRSAKLAVISAGFEREIEWQASRCPDQITPEEFLSEAAWVIINSGFRESVARRLFPAITLCFCDWEAAEIARSAGGCRAAALKVFAHAGKIDAIIDIAMKVDSDWPALRNRIADQPLEHLKALPFIGPITASHLAKNLGYSVAKADRHLVRTANTWGCGSVQALCDRIALATGDPVGVVDLVLWRHAVESKRALAA